MEAKVIKSGNPLVNQIMTSLEDRKAQDIVCLDLRGNEDATVDYMIVCHGDSTTQVNAIAGNLEKEVSEKLNTKPSRIEGERNALWVLVDYFDVVVHIFHHEMREFYRLEDLWSDAMSPNAPKEKRIAKNNNIK